MLSSLAIIVYGFDQGRDVSSLSWGYVCAVAATIAELLATLLTIREYHTSSRLRVTERSLSVPLLLVPVDIEEHIHAHAQHTEEVDQQSSSLVSVPRIKRKRSQFRKAESLPESQLTSEHEALITDSSENHGQTITADMARFDDEAQQYRSSESIVSSRVSHANEPRLSESTSQTRTVSNTQAPRVKFHRNFSVNF